MRQKYLKVLVGLVVLVWTVYLIQAYMMKKTEPFTPYIRGLYRPYIRQFNHHYDRLKNNYGFDVIWTKLRKWNIW
jgi:hypothetical protein